MRSDLLLAVVFLFSVVADVGLGSPAITMRSEEAITGDTDIEAQLEVLFRGEDKRGGNHYRFAVVRVKQSDGRKAKQLPPGTYLSFVSYCREPAKRPDRFERPVNRMTGYPSGDCGTAWTALPGLLVDPNTVVSAALQVSAEPGERTTFNLVATTHPPTGGASGHIIHFYDAPQAVAPEPAAPEPPPAAPAATDASSCAAVDTGALAAVAVVLFFGRRRRPRSPDA